MLEAVRHNRFDSNIRSIRVCAILYLLFEIETFFYVGTGALYYEACVYK